MRLYFTRTRPIHCVPMPNARRAFPFWAFALIPLSLTGQQEGILPPEGPQPTVDLIEPVPPPVDLISPVPAPEIPLIPVPTAPQLPENLKIENLGGSIEGNLEDGIRLGGPVKVIGDNGLEVFSDRANVDLKEKSVTFEGNVSVYQENILQRGDRAVYYYEQGTLDATGLRVSLDPILLEAGKFTATSSNGRTIFVGENAGVTTDDSQDPDYWVRARKTTVYPGEKVVFNDLKLYAGDTPIFWLPYLSQPLDSELGYHFLPGARSTWGPFLLNTYGIMLGGETDPLTGENRDAWLLSRWHLDLRAKRGIALGVDLVDTRQENPNEISGFSAYHLYDLDRLESRTGQRRFQIDQNRFQLQLKDRRRFDLEADADWRLDTNLTLLSDQYYLEDFDPSSYRVNPAPDNTLGVFRRSDDSLLSVFGRFRFNDFYRVDTQSPEIALDQARSSLFGSPILHEGQNSFSIRGVEAADFTRRNILDPLITLPRGDPRVPRLLFQLNGYERTLIRQIRSLPPGDPRAALIRAQLLDTGFHRLHSNHSFSLPITHGDWFTLTPRAGAAYTHYSSVQGPAGTDARFLLHGGAQAAVKFSKRYGTRNRRWGLDDLLHVIQPYTDWSVVGADELDQNYPKIDRLTFTTRPRSLDPSRYTAIDEFNSWNIVRLGVRNQLITRRSGQSHHWLAMNTYIDKYIDDPEGDREYSNLYNEIQWQPLPWLGLDLETQLPVVSGGSGFSELNSNLRIMPYRDMEISLGYRHLANHPVLLPSERIDLETYTRLSENWGFGSRHVFEFADSTLEYQQYTLHRDFGNWVAGLGVSSRDNRFRNEYGILFSFTLKDFPSASLPFKIDTE